MKNEQARTNPKNISNLGYPFFIPCNRRDFAKPWHNSENMKPADREPRVKIMQGYKIPRPTHPLTVFLNKSAINLVGNEVVFSARKMTIRGKIFLEEKVFKVNPVSCTFQFSANSKEEAESLIGQYELEKDGDDYFLQKIQ